MSIDYAKLVEYLNQLTREEMREYYKPEIYTGMCYLKNQLIAGIRNGKLEDKKVRE